MNDAGRSEPQDHRGSDVGGWWLSSAMDDLLDPQDGVDVDLIDPRPPMDPAFELLQLEESAAQFVADQRLTLAEIAAEDEWNHLEVTGSRRVAERLLMRRRAAIGAAADQLSPLARRSTGSRPT